MRAIHFHNPDRPASVVTVPRLFTLGGVQLFPCACGSTDDVRLTWPTDDAKPIRMCAACRTSLAQVQALPPVRRVHYRVTDGTCDPPPLVKWPAVCITCGSNHDLRDVPTTGAATSVKMCIFCRRDAGME